MTRKLTTLLLAALFSGTASAIVRADDEKQQPQPAAQEAVAGQEGDEVAPPPDEMMNEDMDTPPMPGMGENNRDRKGGEKGEMRGKNKGAKAGKAGKMGPGGDMKGGPMMGGRPGAQFFEKMRESVLKVIRDNDAALADKLEKMEKENAPAFAMSAKLAAGSIMPLMIAHKEGDKAAEKSIVKQLGLELEVRELADKYKAAKAAEKESLKPSLESKVAALFDARVANEDLRLKMMENKLKELREQSAKKKSQRSALIKEKVQELTGEKVRF